ncbi:hypothetical protein C8J56DRAFT_227715 [Mycena floridula]|nr:hypothetical protein C8J56DRAFT_227715 [Mycena floridula]
MSSLRRLAVQTNNGSPRNPTNGNSASMPSTPTPSTPKNRPRPSIANYHSPASTPSISSSVPFDWEAVRSRRPAPYSSPLSAKSRKGRPSLMPDTPGRKSIVRKKSFFEKLKSIPSRIAFEIAVFPNNVPLPTPKTSAFILGGLLHFIHLCVRIRQTSQVPDSDLGWEDMYHEDQGKSWFDWTFPFTLILIAASVLNALYLFTRSKIYRLHRQSDPVSSPNAKFVAQDLDFAPLTPPSLASRLSGGLWNSFILFWRFLLGLKAAPLRPSRTSQKVQELLVWTPGELEMRLFCVYSPVHSLLWMGTGSANWMLMGIIMGIVGVQLHVTTSTYKNLMKDREIIAAEVMHEYNEGFVYPRVNPIRKDVAVMTHQSEVVNVWED